MKVLTSIVNNPLLIEIQYKTLKKYLKNEFEYIVFNDAKNYMDPTNPENLNIRDEINEMCKKLKIKCINVPNDNYFYKSIRCSSTRKASVMNFILKYQIKYPDQYLILDSDIFLIDYLDINERYKEYKMAFSIRQNYYNEIVYKYIKLGVIYMDTRKIEDIYYLDWGINYGITDIGGLSYDWLNRQLGKGERIPTKYELYFNQYDNYNTKNIYFMKILGKNSWTIKQYPENLKNEKFKNFLIEDNRNNGELIYGEIFDNIFYHFSMKKNKNQLELLNKFNDIINLDDN